MNMKVTNKQLLLCVLMVGVFAVDNIWLKTAVLIYQIIILFTYENI